MHEKCMILIAIFVFQLVLSFTCALQFISTTSNNGPVPPTMDCPNAATAMTDNDETEA